MDTTDGSGLVEDATDGPQDWKQLCLTGLVEDTTDGLTISGQGHSGWLSTQPMIKDQGWDQAQRLTINLIRIMEFGPKLVRLSVDPSRPPKGL